MKKCSSCGADDVSLTKGGKGTFLKVTMVCLKCAATDSWESQPWYHGRPAGNLLLSGAILFAGGSPSKVLRVLESLRVKAIAERTFYRHQDEFLHPIIENRWRLQQTALLQQLKAAGKPLVIGGDGRADSPGHSAKYGIYTGLELQLSKIVDFQLVQVGCYCTCNSYVRGTTQNH